MAAEGSASVGIKVDAVAPTAWAIAAGQTGAGPRRCFGAERARWWTLRYLSSGGAGVLAQLTKQGFSR